MGMKTLHIIGCGPGARNYLTLAAIEAAARCEVLMGSPRLLALFDGSAARAGESSEGLHRRTQPPPPPSPKGEGVGRASAATEYGMHSVQRTLPLSAVASEAIAAIEARPEREIGVLVSGDPGVSSLATPLVQHFGKAQCHIIPGISSVQLAAAALGMDWLNARVISAHGADPQVDLDSLRSERRLIILGGRPASLAWIAHTARSLGGVWRCWVLENLSLPEERKQEVNIDELPSYCGSSLVIVVLEKA